MLIASGQHVFGSRPPAGPSGFTLVELLLVMFVLSILVALVVGVGSYVIEQARITETVETQLTLLAAVDAYRRVTGDFPEPNQTVEEGSIEGLLTILQASGDASALGEEIRKQTLPFLQSGGSLQVDAFGNPMHYYPRRGIGGKPLVISAGPDGDFGEMDESKQRDNIRSDTQGTDGQATY